MEKWADLSLLVPWEDLEAHCLEANENRLGLQSHAKGLKHAILNFVFESDYIFRHRATAIYDCETVFSRDADASVGVALLKSRTFN